MNSVIERPENPLVDDSIAKFIEKYKGLFKDKNPEEMVRKAGEYHEDSLMNIIKENQYKNLEEIRAILTKEEFEEYRKELDSKWSIDIVGIQSREEIEEIEKFQSREVDEFISKYAGKEFHISQEFFDYSMQVLFKTFKHSHEYPLVGIFKQNKAKAEPSLSVYSSQSADKNSALQVNNKHNEKMVMKSFLDSKWLFENGYTNHYNIGCRLKESENEKKYSSTTSILQWIQEKFFSLKTEAKINEECLIRFHTHPGTVYPSSGDKITSEILGIIGFEKTNRELGQLYAESIESATFFDKSRFEKIKRTPEEYAKKIEKSNQPSYRKKIDIYRMKRDHPDGINSIRQKPFEVDENLWKGICEECRPTIGLFVIKNQEVKRIPLYLNGKII